MNQSNISKHSWSLDQIAKSSLFHSKVHEWGLLEVAEQIESLEGERYDWQDLENLGIHPDAWSRVIHRGIKPVTVFAHPEVLCTVSRSTTYYRMLAMVSQKSMSRLGLDVKAFEDGTQFPSETVALQIAQHLNPIISRLVLEDDQISPRELDLWRGMAAGTQAQGSWQNQKGKEIEKLIFQQLRAYLRNYQSIREETPTQIVLRDGRALLFSSDPDILLQSPDGQLLSAVEIKGGIDPAGALERLGASIKSLQRVKGSAPGCTTILLLRESSITDGVRNDIEISRAVIDYWFIIEEILSNPEQEKRFLNALGVAVVESP